MIAVTIKKFEWIEEHEAATRDVFGKPKTTRHSCRMFRLTIDVVSERGTVTDHFLYVPPAAAITRELLYGHANHRQSIESCVRELAFAWHELEPAGAELHHRYGGVDERVSVEWRGSAGLIELERHAAKIEEHREHFTPREPSTLPMSNEEEQ